MSKYFLLVILSFIVLLAASEAHHQHNHRDLTLGLHPRDPDAFPAHNDLNSPTSEKQPGRPAPLETDMEDVGYFALRYPAGKGFCGRITSLAKDASQIQREPFIAVLWKPKNCVTEKRVFRRTRLAVKTDPG
ncbi:hypothetical protein RUND412_007882 [Rhizina undulata]